MTLKGLDLTTEHFDSNVARTKRIAIVRTRWNKRIVDELVEACHGTLGLYTEHVEEHHVPGCFELPLACRKLIQDFDAVIAIGVLIKGETMHFEYIAESVSKGLMEVGLEAGKPVVFGVLTCLDEVQAQARAGMFEGSHNHGRDWALAALEMAVNYASKRM
jgi:6,7-dimethyl-8-ribityllumazine synthase